MIVHVAGSSNEKKEVIEVLLVSQFALRDGVGVSGSPQVCRVKFYSIASGQKQAACCKES